MTQKAVSLSNKQRQILNVLIKGNPDGSWVDMDQLLGRLPYRTTKPSLQHSIRILIKKGLMERKETEHRREAYRRLLAPTMLAYELMRDKNAL